MVNRKIKIKIKNESVVVIPLHCVGVATSMPDTNIGAFMVVCVVPYLSHWQLLFTETCSFARHPLSACTAMLISYGNINNAFEFRVYLQ